MGFDRMQQNENLPLELGRTGYWDLNLFRTVFCWLKHEGFGYVNR